ncbi:hypothetical protein SAMN05421870_115137 [Streptomyces qinglanensis]|uniref:Uncharacterized protein n=1 Tax=Streptomyces qinglanensis TaxID=943816 RepID=A0A1H9W7R6_9ACTN|nr:hypothetical protein SAMN05421870_115137 [Streptomyces qinglanensis]
MAFGPHELRVLGGALAIALQSDPAPERVQEYLRLVRAVDEAIGEGARLRSFVRADLARHRAALPGAAAGYLEQLADALAAGYLPVPADLAALRALCAQPVGPREAARRTGLLRRAEEARVPRLPRPQDGRRVSRVPAVRAAGQAGQAGQEDGDGPEPAPRRPGKPSPGPAEPAPAERPATPSRPVPTPAEVFPPRRRTPPAPPPPSEPSAEPGAEPDAEPDTEQGLAGEQGLVGGRPPRALLAPRAVPV